MLASNGKTCVWTATLLVSGSDATPLSDSLANKLQFSGTTKEIALTMSYPWKKVRLQLVNFSILLCNHPEMLPVTNAWVVFDLTFSASL